MADRVYYARTSNKWSSNIVQYDLQPLESGQTAVDEPLVCNETRYPLLHRCFTCGNRMLRSGDFCVYCGGYLTKGGIYAALLGFFARLLFPVLLPAEAAAANYEIPTTFLQNLFPELKSLDLNQIKNRFQVLELSDLLADIARLEADPALVQTLALTNDPVVVREILKDFIEV